MNRFLKLSGLFLCLVAFVGCGSEEPAQPVSGDNAADKPLQETVLQECEISLYFSDADANYLIEQKRTVQVSATDSESLAIAVVEELNVGPKDNEFLYGVMPEGTQLQSAVLLEDGTMQISLNQAFIDAQYGGSTGMMMTLYGLVNSLACLDGVEAVQILIEGQPVNAYEGLISADEPVIPWQNIVTK